MRRARQSIGPTARRRRRSDERAPPRRRALGVDRDIRRHVEPVIVNLFSFSPIEEPSDAPTSQDSFRHTKNVE
jgi:hypothetical protein